jgi:hypothetical protein
MLVARKGKSASEAGTKPGYVVRCDYVNSQNLGVSIDTFLRYQPRTVSLTVYEAPYDEYLLLPSARLPDSPDRFYWFKPGVLGNIGIPDCLNDWLG